MNFTEVQTVIGITVICYLIGMGCKLNKKIHDEWIPVIVGSLGGLLGLIGMYTMPNYPAHDWIDAIALGIISGLAATGTNQIKKQLISKTKYEIKK